MRASLLTFISAPKNVKESQIGALCLLLAVDTAPVLPVPVKTCFYLEKQGQQVALSEPFSTLWVLESEC